jgi:hypothetical protein
VIVPVHCTSKEDPRKKQKKNKRKADFTSQKEKKKNKNKNKKKHRRDLQGYRRVIGRIDVGWGEYLHLRN